MDLKEYILCQINVCVHIQKGPLKNEDLQRDMKLSHVEFSQATQKSPKLLAKSNNLKLAP